MTTKRRYSLSESRIEEHLQLLEVLDNLPLIDSCCDICHCDCYSSHRSELGDEEVNDKYTQILRTEEKEDKHLSNSEDDKNSIKKKKDNASVTPSPPPPADKYNKIEQPHSLTTLPPTKGTHNESLQPTTKQGHCKEKNLRKKHKSKKRSKSVCARSQSQCSEHYYTRDCEILQNLLTSLDDRNLSKLNVKGVTKPQPAKNKHIKSSKTLATSTKQQQQQLMSSHHFDSTNTSTYNTFAPIRLSESMANLCLVPSVREAYQQVPAHDKRILNRMATKRNEQAVSKENAWLARKYWENERYERELLKCEQMEEYKKAVRDKQFQDYLQTKARLNEIAQRDLCELQRLRESLQQKDDRAKKRLQTLRIEKELSVNQKRCEELRKAEHVSINQEELNLDEMLKKSEICHRLTERLKRADHIRNEILENYLKRLRYDNYIEQLQHEEHWREIQLSEKLKREQLKEEISRKRCRSQHFVETKQKHNESLKRTAKLSKSLRDLVRSSVTPDTGVALYGGNNATTLNSVQTAKLLFDRRPY
ncbi:kinectin [Musca vetustissima]|uniref:kinectin n=1 Tax=Musca vetustissima TaxID=27455 RepID=UPI002AB76495|nr:kinectin [Musca vetustissima]